MSDQRLSKLQKWILENCFRVTILLDRSKLKDLNNYGGGWECRNCPPDQAMLGRGLYNEIQPQCKKKAGKRCDKYYFYKEDILLSFFGLIPDNSKDHLGKTQHFYRNSDYSKAHVTTTRSLQNLAKKGFIGGSYSFLESSLKIWLTDTGIKNTAKLLGLSDYFIPEELPEDVCKKRLEELELELRAIDAKLRAAR